MPSDGKDSLTKLLWDVKRLGTESSVSRCCTYFGCRDVDGDICHGCPAFSYNDCTSAVFCDLAERLMALGVRSGDYGKTCAEGDAVAMSDFQSENGDTTKRLASDLADAVANMGDTFDTFTNVEELGRYRRQLACGYFGHGGYTGCLERELPPYSDECPAYSRSDGTPESCWAAMCDDIARRCMASGIDLGDGEYAKW